MIYPDIYPERTRPSSPQRDRSREPRSWNPRRCAERKLISKVIDNRGDEKPITTTIRVRVSPEFRAFARPTLVSRSFRRPFFPFDRFNTFPIVVETSRGHHHTLTIVINHFDPAEIVVPTRRRTSSW